MRDDGAGLCGSQCGAAGVGEKIQHPDRSSGIADLLLAPVPVDCLFRKKPGVFEAEGLEIELQILIMNDPLFRKLQKFPFASSAGASVVTGIGALPSLVSPGGIPDNLGIRTDEKILSPSFQLLASGAINDLIIGPIICNPHDGKPTFPGMDRGTVPCFLCTSLHMEA